MHLHAIDQRRSCEQRRIDGVNSTPSSRRSYRYSTASMAWGGQMGRRAADRARSSRRRRGAGGHCRRPFLLRFVAFSLLIAPLRATSGQQQKLCAVLTACRQSQRETGLGRLIACERFDYCAQRSCNALRGRLSISAHENVHRACGVTASSSAPSVTGQE